ncbi:MAG: phosphoenolpyruvate carboxykinase (GTP) [Planctomycetota bacterium]
MNASLAKWVDECARIAQPKHIHWCDGSDAEHEKLVQTMLDEGEFIRLNESTCPGSYLHRSHPSDVARTEHLTYICTEHREDAGPTNNWMSPREAREKVGKLFDRAMEDRTMYVMPFLMGPPGSPHAKVGIEITDSRYVVASMRIMTRMGTIALDTLEKTGEFYPGFHSLGDLDPARRFILHFPEEKLIWSVGSGYGGNALLGKKCLSLRIASWIAREEGWLAEHMLILGVENPAGEIRYIAAALPSACGKTNLAMMVPAWAGRGWKVWTVGDDIAWIRPGKDGRLWAVNPEAGFFGVAPGTGPGTNPNALASLRKNSIFTNVALSPANEPWWEGMGPAPEGLADWQGRPWTAGAGKAAHPNSRFTAPARNCPCLSPHWEDPEGVPISAFIFGGRRSRLAPLIYQSFDWTHGVFVGASMASETTAAAIGTVGVTRRDPMAMLPFCGYHLGDYLGHWLATGKILHDPPPIFHVNWFRAGNDGKFLWPGFGENVRVLAWILDRAAKRGAARETPIGFVPAPGAIDTEGLALANGAMEELLRVNASDWKTEAADVKMFFDRLGTRLPTPVRTELESLVKRLG